jgi:amidophosphoribosyltransferase
MSTIGELFAPKFLDGERPEVLSEEVQDQMAKTLGADTLRYLPVSSIARAIGMDGMHLCQACITGRYPTTAGQELYQIALQNTGDSEARTYESRAAVTTG